MKLTKSHLKRLIKEELQKVLEAYDYEAELKKARKKAREEAGGDWDPAEQDRRVFFWRGKDAEYYVAALNYAIERFSREPGEDYKSSDERFKKILPFFVNEKGDWIIDNKKWREIFDKYHTTIHRTERGDEGPPVSDAILNYVLQQRGSSSTGNRS